MKSTRVAMTVAVAGAAAAHKSAATGMTRKIDIVDPRQKDSRLGAMEDLSARSMPQSLISIESVFYL